MMYKGNLSVIPGGRKCTSMLPKLTTAGNAVFKLEGATEYKLYTLCVNNSVFRSCLQLDCYLVLKKWATLWLSLFSFDSFHVVMCVYSMWRVACKSFRVECFIIKLLWRHHLINWFLHDLPCCVIRFFFVSFPLKTHKIIIFVREINYCLFVVPKLLSRFIRSQHNLKDFLCYPACNKWHLAPTLHNHGDWITKVTVGDNEAVKWMLVFHLTPRSANCCDVV